MLTRGLRFITGIGLTAAIALSCVACLGPNRLEAYQRGAPMLVEGYDSYTEPDDPGLIRVRPRSRAVPASDYAIPARAPAPQHLPLTSGTVEPSSRAQTSGIDLAVSGFREATNRPQFTRIERNLAPFDSQRNRFDADYTFLARGQQTGFGVDLAVKPHFTLDQSAKFRSTRAGAEVRVGQNLDLRGQNAKNSNWYVFAGADGEAVVWDMQRPGSSLTSGQVTLQDKVTIGDVQAGIAWQSPAGQMSVSYISREYEYRNGSISRTGEEDFAAITLTWRR